MSSITSSSIKKILVHPKSSPSMSSSPIFSSSLNINADPFFPKGCVELEKIEEDKYFDQLENVWWQENRKMFMDSLAEQEIELEEKIEVSEVVSVSSPSWADIVKKI